MVSKEANNKSALSHVNEVSGKNRVEEIARMISGNRVTDEAREASRVLIAGARRA
jgi:DNA repair protein RecN (Recombination protein N)